MTNAEIITRTAIASGLFSEAEAMAIIQQNGELPLHTFQGWKARGFQVKKGEKSTIRITIWKHSGRKVDKETGEEDAGHHFMKNACFFTASQVEAVQTA